MSWAAVAAGAAGIGSSLINNMGSKDGTQGYDLPMLSNSPYDAGNMRLMGQMGQQGAINAEAGRLPPGMEIMLEKIRKRQLEESKRQMFGDPGRRGGSMMDAAMSAGSMSGVGPKALNTSIMPRALNDYAGRNSQIMNYIDSLKYSGLQKARTESFNQMNAMPRSNEIPYSGNVVDMSTPGQSGMDIDMSGIDWSTMFPGNKTSNNPTPTSVTPQYTLSGAMGKSGNLADKMMSSGFNPFQ